ncbi:hypothetical protein SAMN05421678_11454 [Actinopolymorpha cephalotaxi]|uniref:Uncharacterized protein n=1 Tax=Actinopolymorpha cephalotaxi TaxID=504797 RepID=A0A1I2YG65_9ACTN|nr:hypothetical protein [Actinopolymorpha cephalotaxi]NYH87011.1 hypothetical protein [Actinopolymorpha cephalotaxi]SFH24046.1 hypothetical protein SAMN05421678_11454 [Actinopolymorpha cephalotaxi]
MTEHARHHPLATDPHATGAPAATGLARPEVRGRAVGIVVMSFFAFGWTGWGLSTGVPAGVANVVRIVSALCLLSLLGWAILAFRRSASLHPGTTDYQSRRVGRTFGIVVGAEFLGLFVVAAVLGRTGHPEVIAPVVCLGVGIHFFPLRRLFGVRLYDATGLAMCVTAIATAIVAPLSGNTALWTLLPGLGAAFTLYATGALLLRPSDLRGPS